MNSWLDLLLLVLTPLVVVPIVFLFRSPWLAVEVETISLAVAAFGSLGHHLPGMIRAYGDRELFLRFRVRFILVPIVLFAVFFPLYRYHYSATKLIILFWACWHGLMQVYGFVRIYDAKVGCISRVTAYLDWLMCLSWFSTAQLFSDEKMSSLLEYWYDLGGPLIPPVFVRNFRWVGLAISLAILVAFLANHVAQTIRGPRPNPAKLLMLASGIGCWWFAVVFIENIILGVAIFEVFHDVQYLAIVWLYNCRRVNSGHDVGRFMKFVFRRGMLVLYVGLVFAYGLIGLAPQFAEDATLKTFCLGMLWTSTILHYYYDGFIWKVREPSTRVSLGLSAEESSASVSRLDWGGLMHVLKWSPAIVLLGWLFVSDSSGASVSPNRVEELKKHYMLQLSGSSALPQSNDERSWLYSQFQQAQNIAAAAPGDSSARLRAAIMLANFGRNDEATSALESLLKEQPSLAEGHQALGEIHLYRGHLDEAARSFQAALAHATTKIQRSNANLRWGEVDLRQKNFESAKARFQEASNDNPELEASITALRKRAEDQNASP